MSRWLAVQRSFGSLPAPTLSQSVAFRHGARHSPSRPQRGARGMRCGLLLLRALEEPSPRVPASAPQLGFSSRESCLPLANPPPPRAGSILGKISAGRGLSPGSVLARLPREAPGRCLEDLGHRSPSGRSGARGCCAVSARAAAAGGPRREQPRAAVPAPALSRGSSEPPRLRGAARRGSQRPELRGRLGQQGPASRAEDGRASGRLRGERAAAGRSPPLGHLLAPRPPLEDVSGEAHVLPAGAEQDHLGGARAIPEPVPGGLGSLWLGLVSVAGPRVERRGGASRVAMHA